MPEQIAVAFEIVVAVVEFDQFVAVRTAPGRIKRHFALTRWIHHAAGHGEFAVTTFLADENLIGGEDHIFEAFDWVDGFDFTSLLMQDATESLPLAARFRTVHLRVFHHIRVFLIDDIEKIRGTEQDLRHTIDGSWLDRTEAR